MRVTEPLLRKSEDPMNRSLVRMLTGVLVVSCLAAAPARAGINIQIFPPALFRATTTPVYYEGHASYYYQNRWHYRDGRGWQSYQEEPRYLRDYRSQHEQPRHYYGRDSEHRRYQGERR
jgi:hypothetical protein